MCNFILRIFNKVKVIYGNYFAGKKVNFIAKGLIAVGFCTWCTFLTIRPVFITVHTSILRSDTS